MRKGKHEKAEAAQAAKVLEVRAFLAYPEDDGQYTPMALDLVFDGSSVDIVGFQRLHDRTYEPVAYEYLQGDLLDYYLSGQLKRAGV